MLILCFMLLGLVFVRSLKAKTRKNEDARLNRPALVARPGSAAYNGNALPPAIPFAEALWS
jgi:hypothetical protein